tara:strand:- start:16 stop:609 length:594 start_codon:yes stop_codon:yes gene_type:complete
MFALYSGIKNIVVSSDCDDILSYSKSLGVEVIKRPFELSKDNVPTISVLKHATEFFITKGFMIDVVVTLQPTNPLRKKDLFKSCLLKLQNNNYSSIVSVGLNKKKIGVLDKKKFYKPINYKHGDRSQDLNNSFYENGLIYFSYVKNILENDLLGKKPGIFICDEISSAIDIDELKDFKLGEYLFSEYINIYRYLLKN